MSAYPLRKFPFSLLGYLGATERKRSYLEVGPKKGTAVPLPSDRLGLTPTIPFTAALKPLTVCYTQLRKTRAICRDYAATMRKTSADTRSFMRVTYEVGPQARSRGCRGKGRSSKREGNRRCPSLFAPAARAARSRAPQSAKSPARQRRIAHATRLHRTAAAGNGCRKGNIHEFAGDRRTLVHLSFVF